MKTKTGSALCALFALTILAALLSGCATQARPQLTAQASNLFTEVDWRKDARCYIHLTQDRSAMWKSCDGQRYELWWVAPNPSGQEIFHKLSSNPAGKVESIVEFLLPVDDETKPTVLQIDKSLDAGKEVMRDTKMSIEYLTANEGTVSTQEMNVMLVLIPPQDQRVDKAQKILDSYVTRIRNGELK